MEPGTSSTNMDKFKQHCQTIRKQTDNDLIPSAKVKKKIAASTPQANNPKIESVVKNLFDEDVTVMSIKSVQKNTKMCLNNMNVPDTSNNVEADASQVNVDHMTYSRKTLKRHICEYCNKIFKSNGKLNSHIYSHTGETPFQCTKCTKAFSSKFKLVRHFLIHSEIRKFVCPICDRTFLRNDHLKNHVKIHDPGKRVYSCDRTDCGKKYSSHLSYKKHVAWHLVEDGCLICFVCNKKYETKCEIQLHLKTHSASRLFKTQSDRKFKCQFCDRLFLTKKDVARHLVVHTGNRDFLCQYCPQRFGRKDHLMRHIKKSHSIEKKKKTRTVTRNLEKYKKKEMVLPKKLEPMQNIPNIYIIPSNSILLVENNHNDDNIDEPLLVTNSRSNNNNSETETLYSSISNNDNDNDNDNDKNVTIIKSEPELTSSKQNENENVDDDELNLSKDIFVGGCDEFDSIQLLDSNELEGTCLSLGNTDDDNLNLFTNNQNGGEILRNLLNHDDILSTPLPGFNQIFHSPASN